MVNREDLSKYCSMVAVEFLLVWVQSCFLAAVMVVPFRRLVVAQYYWHCDLLLLAQAVLLFRH